MRARASRSGGLRDVGGDDDARTPSTGRATTTTLGQFDASNLIAVPAPWLSTCPKCSNNTSRPLRARARKADHTPSF